MYRIILPSSLTAIWLLMPILLSGCGPSVEEQKVIATFNQLDELIEKGGYVKKLDKFEKRPDKVFFVEAEIVNEAGLPIGRLRSERVEGFGTAKPRIQWYKTPGVSEEWVMQDRRRGRRGQGRPNGPDGPRRNREDRGERKNGPPPPENPPNAQ